MLILFSLSTASALANTESEIDRSFALVEKHIALFKVDETDFKLLESVLQKEPDDPYAHFLLARCYARNGLLDMSSKEFKLAEKLELKPEHLLRRLRHQIEAGELSEAYNLSSFVRDRAPDDPNLLFLNALFYQEQSLLDIAIPAYKELLARADCPLGAATAYAGIKIQQGHYKDAIELAQRDLKKNPEYVSARIAISQAWLAIGNGKAAIKALKPMLEIQPFNRKLNLLLYRAYMHEGMEQEAFAAALRNLAGSDYISYIDDARIRVKNLLKTLPISTSDQIIDQISKDVDRTDYSMKFHFYLGWNYYELHMGKRAMEQTKLALDLDPYFEPNWYQQARIKEVLFGDLEGALHDYKKARSLQHSDTKTLRASKRVSARLRNKNDLAAKMKNLLRAATRDQ